MFLAEIAALEGIEGHGALTYTILEALKEENGNIKGDINKNKTLMIKELGAYVEINVPEITQSKKLQVQEAQFKKPVKDFPLTGK